MTIQFRIAAVAVGLALVALVAAPRPPSPSGVQLASATLDASLFAHAPMQEDARGERESDSPADHDQGATLVESQQFEQEIASLPAQWQAIEDHNNARRGPLQPIPFNHRFHTTDLQIDCMYCHTGTERSGSGVVPPLDVCMGCHRIAGTGLPPIEELRGYEARGEAVPWKWVNKLPEFAQFTHQPHLRNGLECAECHGPVEEMDRVYQWAPLTMGWCLECHRQPPTETDVATDHVLSSINPPPQPPEERQDGSFYPRGIDTQYGATRAPTDCAACHY